MTADIAWTEERTALLSASIDCSKVLLVLVGLPSDTHTDALVEMEGSGEVCGVYIQINERTASGLERSDCMRKQCTTDASASHGVSNAEREDVALFRIAGVLRGSQANAYHVVVHA